MRHSKAWESVTESFEVLGEHLRGHFEQVSGEASTERAAFEKTVRGLLTALEDGFGAAGKALRDPALRHDVANVAGAVRTALLDSVEAAGSQARERLSVPVSRDGGAAAKRATTARKPVARKAATRKTAAGKPAAAKRTTTRRAAG